MKVLVERLEISYLRKPYAHIMYKSCYLSHNLVYIVGDVTQSNERPYIYIYNPILILFLKYGSDLYLFWKCNNNKPIYLFIIIIIIIIKAKNIIFPTTFFTICWSDKLQVVGFHMDSPTNISLISIIHNLTFLQVVKNNCVCKFIL